MNYCIRSLSGGIAQDNQTSETLGANGSMGKQQPPPPPESSDSDDGEESPPPVTYSLEKPSAGSNAVDPRNRPEALSDSTDGEEDDSFDTEESYEDYLAVTAKNNPPPPQQASQSAGGKQISKPDSSSECGSEEGDDSEEEDSSESDLPPPPPPPPKETGNAGGDKMKIPSAVVEKGKEVGEDGDDDDEEEEEESSSESDQTTLPPLRSLRNLADPLMKPISSKTMDSTVKPLEKGPINGKRPVPSPAPFSEKKKKKKTVSGDGAEAQQEKQELRKRTKNVEDELMLHAGIQHHKERENIVTSKFSEEYPSLYGFLMREHASKNSLLLLSVIPKTKAKELDEMCKKLVIAEVQLYKQKNNVLADALQLITNAFAERR